MMKKNIAKIALILVVCMCLPLFAACDVSGIFGKQPTTDASDKDDKPEQDETNAENSDDFEMVLGASSNCYKIASYEGKEKHLVIPAMHNGIPVVEIGEKAFMNSKDLVSVVIPDSVEIIGNSAFKNCQKLELVTIGEYQSRLYEIGKQAFFGCSSLEFIEFVGEEDSWNSIAKGKDWDKNAGSKTQSKKYEVVFIATTEVPTEKIESDPIDTEEPEEIKFSCPAYGTIFKGHDPTVQVWNETLGEYRIHLGIDIATALYAPVYAVADGTISIIWNDALMGQSIAIYHGNGLLSFYKNLDPAIESDIVKGVKVKGGQKIGVVGATAYTELADEPHLHFEMTLNGISVNPKDYLKYDDSSIKPGTDTEIVPPIDGFKISLPVEGEIFKGHDPNIQVWSETYGDYRVHLGIDIETEEFAPVYAAADGVVGKIWVDALMGQCLTINHANGFVSFYKNLDDTLADGIEEGCQVTRGTWIGNVGNTAISELADPAHLHFEMTNDGVFVDPEKYCNNDLGNIAYDACNHQYQTVTVWKKTCEYNGLKKTLCPWCNDVKDEIVSEAEGHNLVVIDEGATPLCGNKYMATSVCTVCNETVIEERVAQHQEGKILRISEPTVATYGYTLIECSHCGGQYRTDIKAKLNDTSVFEPYYRSKGVLEGKYRWLFYLGDNSAAYYNGTNILSDEELQGYLYVLTTLNELCKSQGKTLQISVWPNKDQVYPEFTGLEDVGYQNKRTYQWINYVNDAGINAIYPIEELMEMKPYFDVYCQYDSHWNNLGAYIGYQAMLESLGLETVSVHDLPVFEYTGGNKLAEDHYYTQLRGDMLGMGGWSFNAADYPNHRNYYVKYRSDVVYTFVDGTDNKNGGSDIRHTVAENATYDLNFVMIADMYRVMQLGYIEKDFSDAYLCHRSQVNESQTVEAVKNADVIVIAAVERYDSDIINTAKKLISILSSN